MRNDERIFDARDVYELGSELGIRCIYDELHDRINRSLDLSAAEIIKLFSNTFSSRRQKIHYSQQEPGKRPGAHSLTMMHKKFREFYYAVGGDNLDVMLEVKDKDLSCIKCINSLGNEEKSRYAEWARYKYFVMEKDIRYYDAIRKMFSNETFSYDEFYDIINDSIYRDAGKGSSMNAFMHVWGYFKKEADEKEKKRYAGYVKAMEHNGIRLRTVKDFLLSLAVKYDVDYLKRSIYLLGDIYDR